MNVILSVLEGSGSDGNQLDAALQVAKLCEGHVAAVHFRPDPRETVPWMGETISGQLIQQMIDAAERDAEQRTAAARAAFDAWASAAGIPVDDDPLAGRRPSCSYRVSTGRADARISEVGRLVDLIVLPRPGDGEGSGARELIFENAVFDTGRPVLLIPPQAAAFGRCAAIFWNGSPEAVRALKAAMPLLRKAERVYALNVSEAGETGVAVAGVTEYLAWHGVRCILRPVVAGTRPVQDALAAEAEALGADLIVMGAYTHSRIRELVLGGVTRELIRTSAVPLLMSH